MNKINGNSSRLDSFLNFRAMGVLAILIILVVGLAIFSPGHNFIRMSNMETLLSYGSEFAIIVLGIGLLMIAGEFDLSIGSVLAFCSFVFVWLFEIGLHPFLAAIITLACGAVTGLINGLITVKTKVLSFVVTLGTMMFWRGLTLMISGGTMRSAVVSDYKFFTAATTGRIGNFFPVQAVWFIVFAIIFGLLLHKNKFGNWIFSTGDNENAARSMCINTDMVKITCFIIVGLLCAFSAVTLTTRSAAYSSRIGTGWELKAMAGAVVGGTSLRGGRGNMIGIFFGALVIVVIENALIVARLAYEWTYMAFGLIILVAALLDVFVEKRRQELI